MKEKNTNRLLCLAVIALIVLLASTAGSVFAAKDTPAVSVKDAKGEAGGTVSVDVVIRNNPGLLGAVFTITYDEELVLTSAANGEAFGALTLTKPGVFASPCRFVWDGQELSDDQVKDGTILTLTFEIAESAKAGDSFSIGIEASADDIVDRDLDVVEIQTSGGTVTVSGGGPDIPEPSELTAKGTLGERLAIDFNNPSEDVMADVILCLYEKDGRFAGMKSTSVLLASGESRLNLDRMANDGDRYYEAFVIDEFSCPLCEKITFTAEEESGELNLSVETVKAKAGDKNVTVAVNVKNNPGILGMVLSVTYDSSLTLVGAESGEAVSGVLTLTKPGVFESGCSFVWDGQSVSEADIQDGAVLLLTFNVSDAASAGLKPISLSYDPGDIVDAELEDLAPQLVSGGILVR